MTLSSTEVREVAAPDREQAARSRRVAVLQSCYLPWRGYFDLMQSVDVFVFYDDVKYTKNDWRNRNIVKMRRSPVWLTIPIGNEATRQRICDVEIRSHRWQLKHWRTLNQCYGKCDFFARYAPFFEDLYCRQTWKSLSELNQLLIRQLAEWLGIEVEFRDSRSFELKGKKLDRLLDLLTQLEATTYFSGPAARAYIDPSEFARRDIDLKFMEYRYPEYPQGEPPFLPNMSVVDLLFRFGPDSGKFIWGKQ
jgi:hypothetical protein